MNKPASMRNAEKLLYYSLGVDFFSSMLIAVQTPELFRALFQSYIFSYAILCFLIYKIVKGKNWARFAFLVMIIIGLTFIIPILPTNFEDRPLNAIIMSIIVAMRLFALILLFQEPSSDWFRHMKSLRFEDKQILRSPERKNANLNAEEGELAWHYRPFSGNGKPEPAAVSQFVGDVADQIKKLADLREQGILTEEEFAQQKAKILNM